MKVVLLLMALFIVATSYGQGRAPAIDPDIIINKASERAPQAVPPQEWNFKNPIHSRNLPPAGVVIGTETRLQWAKDHSPRPTVFNLGHMALLFGILALPLALFFMIRTVFGQKDGPTWSENLTAQVFQMEGERLAKENHAKKHAKVKGKEKNLKKVG